MGFARQDSTEQTVKPPKRWVELTFLFGQAVATPLVAVVFLLFYADRASTLAEVVILSTIPVALVTGVYLYRRVRRFRLALERVRREVFDAEEITVAEWITNTSRRKAVVAVATRDELALVPSEDSASIQRVGLKAIEIRRSDGQTVEFAYGGDTYKASPPEGDSRSLNDLLAREPTPASS